MNIARILVLLAAGVAGVFVWMYVRNSSASTPPPVEVAAPASSTLRVLVAARDLELGQRVGAGDFVWRDWPESGVAPVFITDRADANALDRLEGTIVRAAFAQGEPAIERKLVAPGDAGFMAAILTPGYRAVSTEIRAATAAGGFILPGDRVDVVLTTGDSGLGGGGNAVTLLENVRVLAIDQSPQRDDEEAVKVGQTATLELSPGEVETLALAQSLGDITLSLRSVADIDGKSSRADDDSDSGSPDSLLVYRYGARSATAVRSAQ